MDSFFQTQEKHISNHYQYYHAWRTAHDCVLDGNLQQMEDKKKTL